MIKNKIINYFSKSIKDKLLDIDYKFFESIQEIRIRSNKCIIFRNLNDEFFLNNNGTLTKYFIKDDIFVPTNDDIKKTLEIMSDYSIYAFEQELKNGFITLNGGFRVGITGTSILEGDKIKGIKNISSINLRIAKEVLGCSKNFIPYIKNRKFFSTMIISPPNCGKTTLLRDIIKEISENGENISVIDERSEIAGIYMGLSQMNLGIRTDIFDRCPKDEGMNNVLRSMSPDFIAIDEIGTEKDLLALEKIFNSGVKVICTAHSKNIDELKNKYGFSKILENKFFKRYIVLKKDNFEFNLANIYDENLEKIF